MLNALGVCVTPLLNMENKILDSAVDTVIKETPNVQEDPRALVERVTHEFIKEKINDFPRMCQVAGIMNKEKRQMLEEVGNKGKYTDSYGWSEDGTMLADYDIPQDLYNFMTTFIYKEFWSNDNQRVWRKFMDKICKGLPDYEYMELFVKLKNYFGDTNLVKMRGYGANNKAVS